ncbi:MAG TPA: hypothetical protein VGJ74_12750 [Burkholderiales bacterium]
MTLLGIGAMASPRYRPAGLLVEYAKARVMIDGGPGAAPAGRLDDWLVSDAQGELMATIRRLARRRRVEPAVRRFEQGKLSITPRRVVHTSHPAFGYLIRALHRTAVWAPEFYRFPRWARGADLMFAEAASWSRPIRFAGGVGGHAAVLDVARSARRAKVKQLVFAHVGRPTIRALERGETLPFGELGKERRAYCFRRSGAMA